MHRQRAGYSAEQIDAARRAQQASVVEGLRQALSGEEQLLAFCRAQIVGGWRSKLALGPEAFFAAVVNVGLTDRRLIVQHVQTVSGKPAETAPHSFALGDIVSASASGIETFGRAPACRLTIRLTNGEAFRLRADGEANTTAAGALADVFRAVRQPNAHDSAPAQVCTGCGRTLDQPYRFCPYCGAGRSASPVPAGPDLDPAPESDISVPNRKDNEEV